MPKLQLQPEFDYDFDLIGISCHLKDYRLCFEMNKHLEIDLQRDNDLLISKRSDSASFSLSLFIDDENHREYYLIANKGTKGLLIPEQKAADFFLILKGVFSDEDMDETMNRLKEMEVVLAVYAIQVDSLKSKANLLF